MNASLQPQSASSSRRAVLLGALGGIGAWAAAAVGRPARARATDGDAMLVGGGYSASNTTELTNSTNATTIFSGVSVSGIALSGESGSAIGVRGSSVTDTGVYGSSAATAVRGDSSDYIGVYGQSTSYIGVAGFSSANDRPGSSGQSAGDSTGVQGFSGAATLPAAKPKTGVYGYAGQDSNSKGVYGESPAGYAGYFAGKVYTTKFHEMTEITAPAAPGANKARLFLKDSGSGKTQLCVRFNTGAVQVLATQP